MNPAQIGCDRAGVWGDSGPPQDSQRIVTAESEDSQFPPKAPSFCPSCPCLFLPTVPPRFVNKVRATPFVEGEDAQITCTVEGAPYPQIR